MATIKESAESRQDLYSVLPTFVRIPGVDFEVHRGDEGFDERTQHLTEDHEAVVDLVKSILHTRWIAPFDVKRRTGNGGEYVNVNGRFRTFACRIVNEILAGERAAYCKRHGITGTRGEPVYVPIRVLSGASVTGDRLIEISIAENAVRFDDPPVTLAHKFDRLRSEHGWSIERIAEASRVTPQSVRNTLSLLKLESSVAAQVNDGTYGPTTGYELAKLPAATQAAELAKLVESRGGADKVRKTDVQAAVFNAVRALPSGKGDDVVDAEFIDAAPAASASAPAPKAKAPKATPPAPPTTKHAPPGIRDFKALLRGLEEGTLTADSLPEDVWRAIRWAAGDLSPTRIAGLSQALKIMGRIE